MQIQIPAASSIDLLYDLPPRVAYWEIFLYPCKEHYPEFFTLMVEISVKVYYFGLKSISYFEIKNENENCKSWSK
jgi:hypothetical protein